jgi:hypothetical protein
VPGKGSCFSCIFPKVRVAEPRKSLPDLDLQD